MANLLMETDHKISFTRKPVLNWGNSFKEPSLQLRVEMAQTKPEDWDKVPARGLKSEPSQPEVKVKVPVLT